MNFSKLAIIFISMCNLWSTNLSSKNHFYSWEALDYPSELFLFQPELAGKESNVLEYLCRALHNDLWVPGKLFLKTDTILCIVPNRGKEHEYTQFQLLRIPAGTTSWEPVAGKLPADAIQGGQHWDGSIGYVCRGFVNDYSLVPGILTSDALECYVPYGGEEIMLTENLEVLVVNMYGKYISNSK